MARVPSDSDGPTGVEIDRRGYPLWVRISLWGLRTRASAWALVWM